jgi:hypothetical protein
LENSKDYAMRTEMGRPGKSSFHPPERHKKGRKISDYGKIGDFQGKVSFSPGTAEEEKDAG